MSKQNGFSLVELMVSMALSLILMSGLIKIYLTVHETHRLQQAIKTMQEEGQFASAWLTKRIRLAGNSSCETAATIRSLDAIHGFAAKTAKYWAPKAVDNTDVIVIGECANVHGKEKFVRVAYYIADTGRKNSQHDSIFSLYRKEENTPSEEWIAGMSMLKIRYGVRDASGQNIISYKTAGQILDWRQVYSIDLAMVLDSQNPVLQKPLPYYLNGEHILPSDRRLYRPWYLYVALRER